MTEAVKVIKPECKLYYMFIDVQKTHTFGYLMQRGIKKNSYKYKSHVLISTAATPYPPCGIWRVHTSQVYLLMRGAGIVLHPVTCQHLTFETLHVSNHCHQ